MISLADAIAQKRLEIGNPKVKSQRADLLGQLYDFYEKDYSVQTWKEYVRWLKDNRKKHCKDTVAQYKKVAYPKITVKSFSSYWLSHIPTEDLYYILSIARDKHNRSESFNRWLFWSLKAS